MLGNESESIGRNVSVQQCVSLNNDNQVQGPCWLRKMPKKRKQTKIQKQKNIMTTYMYLWWAKFKGRPVAKLLYTSCKYFDHIIGLSVRDCLEIEHETKCRISHQRTKEWPWWERKISNYDTFSLINKCCLQMNILQSKF